MYGNRNRNTFYNTLWKFMLGNVSGKLGEIQMEQWKMSKASSF